MNLLQKIGTDPRHYQIITLSLLLLGQTIWADFGPKISIISLTLISTLSIQALFSLEHKYYDFRSPLITGLSLCLLLRAAEWWIYPLAALIAIGSKFLLRFNDKHVFNPANIAIVCILLLLPNFSWVSPGQWGSTVWLVYLLASLAFLVLYRIPKADISLFFLISFAALVVLRALWLGDPLSIPIHQLQSGALLIFAFFMISDPKTTPDNRWGRFLFALAVAVIAFTLQFGFQVREGLFYSLTIISMLTPFLDKLMPGPRYEWRKI